MCQSLILKIIVRVMAASEAKVTFGIFEGATRPVLDRVDNMVTTNFDIRMLNLMQDMGNEDCLWRLDDNFLSRLGYDSYDSALRFARRNDIPFAHECTLDKMAKISERVRNPVRLGCEEIGRKTVLRFLRAKDLLAWFLLAKTPQSAALRQAVWYSVRTIMPFGDVADALEEAKVCLTEEEERLAYMMPTVCPDVAMGCGRPVRTKLHFEVYIIPGKRKIATLNRGSASVKQRRNVLKGVGLVQVTGLPPLPNPALTWEKVKLAGNPRLVHPTHIMQDNVPNSVSGYMLTHDGIQLLRSCLSPPGPMTADEWAWLNLIIDHADTPLQQRSIVDCFSRV